MFLLRAWLLVTTLVLGVLVLMVVLGPARRGAELERESALRAERAAQAASLTMRANMARWIDTTAQVGVDAVLQEAISEADRESKELGMLQKSLRERLRGIKEKTRADIALALDLHGRLVAQIGFPDTATKDKGREQYAELDGVPAALRGTRGDTVWRVHDRAYRVALAPIGRDRTLGAVVLGQELGPELLATLRDAVDTDLIIADGKQVYAAVPARPAATDLPAALARAADKKGRISGVRIGHGSDGGIVSGSALDGAADGVVLCAFVPRPEVGSLVDELAQSLRSIVASAKSGTLAWGLVAAVLGGLLAVLLLGQLLVSVDGTRPVARLLAQVQLVARGDSQRIDADRVPRRFAGLVRVLNVAFDRLGQRARPAPTVKAPSDRPTPPPASPSAERRAVTVSGSFASPPAGPNGPSEDFVAAPQQVGHMWAAAPAVPSASAPAPAPPAPAPVPAPAALPDEEELRGVFRDFVETRETCGESVEGLTFEKFAHRLLATKAQVLRQHGGTHVRYGVYVKDGKAAIKVTPQPKE